MNDNKMIEELNYIQNILKYNQNIKNKELKTTISYFCKNRLDFLEKKMIKQQEISNNFLILILGIMLGLCISIGIYGLFIGGI